VSTLAIVLVAVAVLLLALIVGGIIASGRRRRDDEERLRAELVVANEQLALAHAQDKGWERGGLERAARAAFARRSPAEVRALHLVQVVDRPGTEEDQAVFRVETDHGAEYVHLHRSGDTWAGEDKV
jgi:hypothetical protein